MATTKLLVTLLLLLPGTGKSAELGDMSWPPRLAIQASQFVVEDKKTPHMQLLDSSAGGGVSSGFQQSPTMDQPLAGFGGRKDELVFSNQTGATLPCQVGLELARSMGQAEQSQPAAADAKHQEQEEVARGLGLAKLEHFGGDLQVRWEMGELTPGEPLEPMLDSPFASQQRRPLRWIRPQDGALVFEPFTEAELRPEVHWGSYRCIASSRLRGASLAGPLIRVRAVLAQSQQQLEVLVPDELVLAGSTALFRCQVPPHARNYLQPFEWVEYPGEQVLTFENTTKAQVARLMSADTSMVGQASNLSQQQQHNSHRHWVAPKSGDLHILQVDSAFNYRSYKCRCKNRLTGELISSRNRGKLTVIEVQTPMAPKLVTAASLPAEAVPAATIYEEGELALLACNVQAHPQAYVSWLRKVGDSEAEPVEWQQAGSSSSSNQQARYLQAGNLLLVAQTTRNDSGTYLCLARNKAGEERLELELTIRAPLKAKLSASAQVLELGKSLALDCTVTGFPIHQVVFRHNQNIIKSIGGNMEAPIRQPNTPLHPAASRSQRPSSYFVLDGSSQEPSESTSLAPGQLTGSNQLVPRASGGQQLVSQHVIVIVLEPQHAGAYQCQAENQFETAQASTYIRVLDDPPKFKETFHGEVYEPGQDVSLLCSARANPLPEITWSIDGQPLPESGRVRFGDFVTKDNLVISYVNISNTQVPDGGLYRCLADNGLAQVSHQALVAVTGAPQVKQMANVTVVASTSFQQRCPAAGHPLGEIQWLHQGRRLPTNHRQHVHHNGTLVVEHMEKSAGDEGEYTCVVQPPSSLQSAGSLNLIPAAHGSLHVTIKVRPTIEPFSVSRSLREGQRASITCTISSGDLPIAIAWFHNDRPLGAPEEAPSSPPQAPQVTSDSFQQHSRTNQGNNSSHQQHHQLPGVRVSRASPYSSTLLFESLLQHHSGNYTCLARNDAGSVSHQTPMIVQVAPKWSLEPSDTNLVRGSSSSIDCMATGFPLPRIIWTKQQEPSGGGGSGLAQATTLAQNNPKDLQQHSKAPLTWRSIVSSPHLQVYENGSLNILDARDYDLGNYMCQASNGVGPGLSKVIRVTINVAAQFNQRQQVQYVNRGEQAQLKCLAKGDGPLQVLWFKNRQRLEPVNERPQQQQPTSAMTQSTELAAAVTSSLLMAAHSQPPTGVQFLQLQSSAQRRRASALGQLLHFLDHSPTSGGQRKQQEAQLVDRYSLTTLESLAATSGSNQPSQNQVQEARSRLALGDEFSLQQQPVVVQVSSQLTIQQADRHDTATFKCLAANYFGLDERTVQLIVQEPPDRVEELQVLEVSSRSVTLGWLAPYDGNAPIASYLIQFRPAPAANTLQQQHHHHQDWSNFTLQQQPPNSANGLSEEASVGKLLQVQARLPTTSTSVVAPSNVARAQVKVSMGSLRPITQYWFRVAAENKLGQGPLSVPVESVTMEEAPGSPPAKLKATAQSSSSVLVSWSRLNDKDTYGSVHGYYVAYKPLLDSAGPTTAQASGLQSSNVSSSDQQQQQPIFKTIQHDDKLNKFDALLTGLRKSTKYMISVQAFNARGLSPSTEPIVIKTLDMDPPKQVKLYVKQATNCTIQLEWRPLSLAAHHHLQLSGGGDSATSNLLPLALPYTNQDDQKESKQQLLEKTNPNQNQLLDQVDYYSLYQAELNERPRWQEIRLPGRASQHLVDNLRCGARYQFYMMGVNKVGVGDQSDILDTTTTGGLPKAPEPQSAFEVINSTCFVLRLDHWQDNGCPIKSFSVRFKPETSRDWVQLGRFDTSSLTEASSVTIATKSSGNRRAARQVMSDRADSVTVLRSKRDLEARETEDRPEDSYLFSSALDSSSDRDDEDSFLDYSLQDVAAATLDHEQAASDYPFLAPSLAGTRVNMTATGDQLFSLLKDSMLPVATFDSTTSRLAQAKQPDWTREFEVAESDLDAGVRTAALTTNSQAKQQQQDWRQVHLCPLQPGLYYGVQVTAANSVGDAEVELRLLTSQEGLEYNEETERLVVSKFASGGLAAGMAQSAAAAASDHLGLAINQWPLLVPMTLTLTLITIIVVAALLLKRATTSSGSTSTATTTTTTTAMANSGTANGASAGGLGTLGGGNHCGLGPHYMAANGGYQHHHHAPLFKHNGAPSAITEAATSEIVFGGPAPGDSYALSVAPNAGPLAEAGAFTSNQLQSIYQQQHRSNQSVFDEPAYGLLANSRLISNSNGLSQTAANEMAANRSTSSPATTQTTQPSSSLATTSGSSGGHSSFNPATMFIRGSSSSTNQLLVDSSQTSATLGRHRNVYLCSNSNSSNKSSQNEEKPTTGELFYGMAPSIGQQQQNGAIYQPQMVQMRQFQAQDVETGSTKDRNYLTSFQQPANNAEHNIYQQQQQQDGDKPDNCFMSIVEQVARANECLRGKQALGEVVEQQRPDESQQVTCSLTDCNFGYGMEVEQQQQQEQQHQKQVANRLMFDPVYATIRRTFPQAIRYLTLQQHHHHHQQQQQAQPTIEQQQQQQQRHSVNDDPMFQQQANYHQQDEQQQQQVAHDMAIFNSNNLAALNLLTPTTGPPPANIHNIQQQPPNNQ